MVESCISRLSRKRVYGDVEDLVHFTETKNGKFPVKSFYYTLEWGKCSLFPYKGIWEVQVQLKMFFHLKGNFG